MIKALLLDLDNTIFPTKTITDEVFAGVYQLMGQYRGSLGDEKMANVKAALSRTPFQKVADEHGFPEELKAKGIELLKEIIYEKPISPYLDYDLVRSLSLPRFLVTFGFKKLQHSKIDCLGVRGDFKEIFVVDPETSPETKRDVFIRIMENYGYEKDELIAVGDDPESEIKAARDLGIKTYLYDPESRFQSAGATWHEKRYYKLQWLIKRQES